MGVGDTGTVPTALSALCSLWASRHVSQKGSEGQGWRAGGPQGWPRPEGRKACLFPSQGHVPAFLYSQQLHPARAPCPWNPDPTPREEGILAHRAEGPSRCTVGNSRPGCSACPCPQVLCPISSCHVPHKGSRKGWGRVCRAQELPGCVCARSAYVQSGCWGPCWGPRITPWSLTQDCCSKSSWL